MDRLENKLLGIHVGCVCVSLRYFVLFWRAESVLSMVDGGRPKFCHINMSLWSVVPPQRASLEKFTIALAKNMPRHSAMVPLFNKIGLYVELKLEIV